MIIRKMAVWGRSGRYRANLAPGPEFSAVRLGSAEAWEAAREALRLLASDQRRAGHLPYRIELTLTCDDGRRATVRYDGMGDASGFTVKAGDPPCQPGQPLLDCVEVESSAHGTALRLAPQRVAGADVRRVAAAVQALSAHGARLAEARLEADRCRDRAESVRHMGRLARQLEARIAWIRERLAFISERLWSFDAAMRARAAAAELDDYVSRLKRDYAAACAALRSVEEAEEVARRAEADPALASPAARVGWDVEEEIRELLACLADADAQAAEAEARQARAQARLAAAKAALTSIDLELGAMDAQRCSRTTAVQAASIAQSIELRQQRIESLKAEVQSIPLRSGSHRLGKALTVTGLSASLACLVALILAPRGIVLEVGGLGVPLPAALLGGLALGLLCAVYGLSEGMEVQASLERRMQLDAELVSLVRQQSWEQQQLRTLLGGRDLDGYMQALAHQDELEAERLERANEVAAALGQVMNLRNQVDYVRTVMTRARERLTEICAAMGVGTPEAFLTQARHCTEAMRALESARRDVDAAAHGWPTTALASMPDLLLEEIAAAEAERAGYAWPGDDSRFAVLSEEHGMRLEEQEGLRDELALLEEQHRAVKAELESIDMWECASRQAAAEAEVRRLEAEAPAVEMACKWLRSVERRMVEAACNALQEHATEVLQFMCDDRDIGLELVPCGDHVELKVTHRGLEPARPDHLVLGVLALDVAAAEMRADEIRPLAVLAGGEDPPELKAALSRLAMMRQVMLMLPPEGASAEAADMAGTGISAR